MMGELERSSTKILGTSRLNNFTEIRIVRKYLDQQDQKQPLDFPQPRKASVLIFRSVYLPLLEIALSVFVHVIPF